METEHYENGPETFLRWDLDAMSLRPTQIHPPRDLRERIHAVEELPPLPEAVHRLLELLDDADADATKLARILELDPVLTAQILRWANSAYYGLREPVDSVRDAVARVLGFDLALNLALGLAALQPLQTPDGGPVGRSAVWRHGLHCGTLMQALGRLLPAERRPTPGLAQLAGLTQNIGYLLLGHLFPAQFAFLSRVLEANPALQLTTVEGFTLGVDHTQLGLWLFETWEMPSPVQLAVRHHHNPRYQGEDETLTLLACLADGLLAKAGRGLGPPPGEGVLDSLMARLDLEPEACAAQIDNTAESATGSA